MFTDKKKFKTAFIEKLHTMQGKGFSQASLTDKYAALCGVIRDQIGANWVNSSLCKEAGEKQVYYFSIEFLIGRLLHSYLTNLGCSDICRQALAELGLDFQSMKDLEPDPGLGNGGLGRLAACFLDSGASLGLALHGMGIRYRYGLFEQRLVNGNQREMPDDWLKDGYPWEFRRPDEAVTVKFGGHIDIKTNGKAEYVLSNYEAIRAVPYDIPFVGSQNGRVNTLRLWSAEASVTDFPFCTSGSPGGCREAMEYKARIQSVSNVLYPDDSDYEGKLLRLKQQYFLVSAGLQNIIRQHKLRHGSVANIADYVAVHINDTHPALVVPELMRILTDEESLEWDRAWTITQATLSYTNHTVMPEAMEKWPVDMFQTLLPRIYLIVHDINEKVCRDLWAAEPEHRDRIRYMAVIADGQIHMANLSVFGSHSINGVSEVHTGILKEETLHDFYRSFPTRFNNKTNGVTHRRWLLQANPLLAGLISRVIGPNWVEYPCELANLLKYTADAALLDELSAIKRRNKAVLAGYIQANCNVKVDIDSLFDVHVKRIHAYKRQILNALHIMHLYNRLKADPDLDIAPRTFIFAGKAAPGYYYAKQVIKLIAALAGVINNDSRIKDKLKVVFLENYNISLAEIIIPAADVSEQIPTASREACGTGNMKFMMNGAITLGTLDGGNIAIKNAVGDDNIFVFGLSAEAVLELYRQGRPDAWNFYHNDDRIKTVLDQLVNGFLPDGQREFGNIFEVLLNYDDFFVLKDFGPYVDAQSRINNKYYDQNQWLKMSLHNIAQAGKFSSDRTVSEYAVDIWGINPLPLRCYCNTDDVVSLASCSKVRPEGTLPT